MTDRESRERLVELIKQATISHLDYLENIDQKGLTDTEGRAKFIADHLLANGVIVLPCRKGTVLNRNGEKCIANHWNIVLTAFNEDNHVRLFDIEEAEKALVERSKQ